MRRVRSRAIASIVVATLALSAWLAAVIMSTVEPVRTAPMNDSGVWVTSDEMGLYLRQNRAAGGLDAILARAAEGSPRAGDLDVLQDGDVVLFLDRDAHTLTPVDVRLGVARGEDAVTVPPNSRVDLRGGTVAVVDPATGNIWGSRYDTHAPSGSIATLDKNAKPLATVGSGAAAPALAISTHGVVHVRATSGKSVTLPVQGSLFAAPIIASGARMAKPLVTTIGEHPVAVDGTTGAVDSDQGELAKLGEADVVVVQVPGPARQDVIVASKNALISVPLAGGAPRTMYSGGNGNPANPVVHGDCLFAAWGGRPAKVVRSCGTQDAQELPVDPALTLKRPVFRVNRGQIVLNDVDSGLVYDPLTRRVIGTGKDIKPPKSPDDKATDETPIADTEGKPKASDDRLQGRLGRGNQLFLLDNDRDPSGRILAIRSVSKVRGGEAVVAPDGQSVGIKFSAGSRVMTFDYTIDNGRDSDSASVRVDRTTRNSAPYQVETSNVVEWAVSSEGMIAIPVTVDWRDKESDPLAIAKADSPNGAVRLSQDGTGIEFTPEANARGQARITVDITDGRDKSTLTIPVAIKPSANGDKVRPLARPDVTRGFVGSPVSVFPVRNDLPGVDPEDPHAELAISSDVRAESDKVQVSTDAESGRVMVSAHEAGTYFLDYSVAYGSAPPASGVIRFDATKPRQEVRPPVAMPDSGVIHGDNAAFIDALANDADLSAGVLTVVSAEAVDETKVQVAVLGGRWLRVTSTQGAVSKATLAAVRYRITNGNATADGDVSVTILPAASPDVVTARADRAVVRTGDTATIPVLDDDSSASGAPLTLLTQLPDAPAPGQLNVVDPARPSEKQVGTAFVLGNSVRYVAPSGVSVARNVVIEYVATTATGDRATGLLTVTIQPAPTADAPNSAPVPKDVVARAMVGETITIPIPQGGDPDGDSTIVAGLASAPRLGRVLGFSPTGLTYQAYPDSDPGTDTFRYRVIDRFGTEGYAEIAVGIVTPQQPMLPVPEPDVVVASPGRTVTTVPTENDLISRGDSVSIELGDAGNGQGDWTLESPRGPLHLKAPSVGGRPIVVPYALRGVSGLSMTSTLTVRSEKGALVPPRLVDVVAKVSTSATTTVDVLERAYDPDGDSRKLKVAAADPGVQVVGSKVTVNVLDRMQAIPFTVTDSDGAVSAAVIYVPAAGSGGPFVPAGKVIQLDPGKAKAVELADYVTSPTRATLTVSSSKRIWPTPSSAVEARLKDADGTAMQVSAAEDYRGPGALVLEVTEGEASSIVSIPVQVGPKVPRLTCPSTPIRVSADGAPNALDIANLCQIWSPDAGAVNTMTFSATWGEKELPGVQIRGNGTRVISLAAGGAAALGEQAPLEVSIDGFPKVTATLQVVVESVAPPTLAPIRLDRVKAGERVTVDVRSYVTSRLPKPDIVVTSIRYVSGPQVATTSTGSRLEITPAADASGTAVYSVEVSDQGASGSRRATSTLSVAIFGVPDAPTGVAADDTVISGRVTVRWHAGAANGSPIDHYLVEGGGVSQRCAASPCLISGLSTGTRVSFVVKAHNEAGYSDPSARSSDVAVDTIPGACSGLRAEGVGDRQIQLTWTAATSDGSPIKNYRITWSGGSADAGVSTSYLVKVPSNDQPVTFTVIAENDAGKGAPCTGTGQSFGPPQSPKGFAATGDGGGGVTLVWSPVTANGPGSVSYTVTENGGTVCSTAGTSCTLSVALDGAVHTYTLVATNGSKLSSSPVSATYTAVGTPDPISLAVTAPSPDGLAVVKYSTGRTNGGAGTMTFLVDGLATDSISVGADGDAGTRSINPGSVGEIHAIVLRLCNEQGRCVDSTEALVSTWAALTAPTLAASLGSDNSSILYEAIGFGNGRDATLIVTIDGVTIDSTYGCKISSCTLKNVKAMTPGTYSVQAQVIRKATKEVMSSGAVTVVVPPQLHPTVSLTGASNSSGCGGQSTQTCYALTITTDQFPADVTCEVTATSGDAVSAVIPVGTTWTAPAAGSLGIGDYDGTWLSVTCGGIPANWKR